MKKKNLMITGVLALTVVLSSGVSLASNNFKNPQKFVELTEEQMDALDEVRNSTSEEAMKNLVSNGTLTQEEADEVLANMNKCPTEAKEFDKENRKLGNLTDEQMEALMAKTNTLFETELGKLVADETITQEIADQLTKERPANEEKHVDGEHRDTNRVSLTQEQMKAINEAREKSSTEALTALVNEGTISEELKDQILNFNKDKDINKNEPKGNMDHKGLSNILTDEQIEAMNTEISKLMKESLAQLVSNGTISQDTADDFKNMPHNRPDRNDNTGLEDSAENL